MDNAGRKAAISAYKERNAPAGIYMLRCDPAGTRWIGFAPDLDTIMNRIRFTLRMGSHRSEALQAAWNAHGADALAFEVLERFDDGVVPKGEALKARLAEWIERLCAQPV